VRDAAGRVYRLSAIDSRLAPLTPTRAGMVASALERRGWRAEAITGPSHAVVEVRDLAMRHTPLVATLRTGGDVDDFNTTHPEHGLRHRRAGCTGVAG
jgi:hypothetical protein